MKRKLLIFLLTLATLAVILSSCLYTDVSIQKIERVEGEDGVVYYIACYTDGTRETLYTECEHVFDDYKLIEDESSGESTTVEHTCKKCGHTETQRVGADFITVNKVVTEVSIEKNVIDLTSTDIAEGTAQSVYASRASSVVCIYAVQKSGEQVTGYGSGSGVFISEDGYIVTCEHVVSEADEVYIDFLCSDGDCSEIHELSAEVVGTDIYTDIAVLKIDKGTYGINYSPLTTSEGDGEYIVAGQSVVAIGNPLGELEWSISTGIISGTERSITVGGIEMTLTQVDAAVNPGNSGGALFDMYGSLIGIVNAKTVSEEVEGIGWAIPSDIAFDVCTDLIAHGYVPSTPTIGLVCDVVSVGIRETYFRITEISIPQSLSGGMQAGDIVYRVDSKTLSTASSFESQMAQLLSGKSKGDTITVVVQRHDGTRYTAHTCTVTVCELADIMTQQ